MANNTLLLTDDLVFYITPNVLTAAEQDILVADFDLARASDKVLLLTDTDFIDARYEDDEEDPCTLGDECELCIPPADNVIPFPVPYLCPVYGLDCVVCHAQSVV